MNISLFALLIAGLVLVFAPAGPVNAQGGSAMELINAVNAYRSANGMQAYDVDGGLMAEAQSHSDYQASIRDCTHTRADGSQPGDHGISAENIACGQNISVQDAIYVQWTDPLHAATILGPTTGMVGAGVSTAGNTVYFTLAVKRLSGDFTYRPPQNSANQAANQANPPAQDPATPQPPAVNSSGIAVSTPDEEGAIAHVIKYGETLVQIADAYHISLADLISINKLDAKNPQYFAGQVLIIRNAFTKTPFMTATYTPRPPTRTPQATRTPRPTRTDTPVYTPIPTRTLTATPLVKLPTLEDLGPSRPVMAYSFIAISALGLLVLIFSAFLPGKKH